MDSGMFMPLQFAAAEALKNGKEWFQELNKMYGDRKKVAMQILDVLGCTYAQDQSGLFVWAKASDTIADVEKWNDEILYGTKVFITPGLIFGDAGKRYIRISLCSTVDALTDALNRIKKFVTDKAAVNEKPSGVKA
jgi:aspartate/methionine/tyrosine aminotransferase